MCIYMDIREMNETTESRWTMFPAYFLIGLPSNEQLAHMTNKHLGWVLKFRGYLLPRCWESHSDWSTLFPLTQSDCHSPGQPEIFT